MSNKPAPSKAAPLKADDSDDDNEAFAPLRLEPAPPKLVLTDVKKAFGSKVVLDGVSLEVASGESLVIIGGSGTGTSVLLKCILGLLDCDSGSIVVDGEEISHFNPRQREAVMHKFGMLFQSGALFDSIPVWENVAFGLIQGRGMARDPARKRAIEVLGEVGLGRDVADLYPDELSGGMRKRVGLARAIADEPDIIFFDEPTTGLDPIMADIINELIVSCVKNLGATAVSITHDMASATKIGDRVSMLHKGKIIWSGAASEVMNSGNPYVDQFVHGRSVGPISMSVRA